MRIGVALLGCLAGALLMASCGGSETNDLTNAPSQEAGAGTGGEAGDASVNDGPGGSGSSGGTGATGGTGGSTGGTGGSTGGTGGSTGGTGGSTGGTGGAPDAGDVSAIATLNDPCSEPGKLACAGHAQKLQLLCDGTKWVSNGVCPGTQFCDTRPGAFAGSCQEAVPECVGQQPGQATCDAATLKVCGPDLVTSTSEQCASAELCQMNDGEHCAACVDGQYRCVGAALQLCGADHMSWDDVMTCASAGICDAINGKCGNQVCVTNQYRCTGDLLEKCNAAGTAWSAVQTCASGLCDAPGKQCDACQPNSASCYNTTTRLVCTADGQSLNAIPCTPPAGWCTNGQCVTCSPTSADYTSRILDMYLMVDRSGSMTGTPWTNQQAALTGFFGDSASAGLGIGMRYFPLDDTCEAQEPTCGGNSYATPLVPWGSLPGHATALTTSLGATQPNGCFTPTQEALNGVLLGARARQVAEPTHVAVAVILSDGEPCCGNCPIEEAAGLGTIAASFYTGTPSIRTFAISIASAANTVMATVAQQGGGQSYNTAGVTAQIQGALADIRDAAGPCVFDIPLPDAGVIDPNAVSVGYLAPGSSNPAPLAKVLTKAACTGDGFYLDNQLSPTKVMLCPATCAAMRANPGAKVRVSVNTCN